MKNLITWMNKMKLNIFENEVLKFLYLKEDENIIHLTADINPAISLSANDMGDFIFESAFLSEGWRKGINNSQAVWIPEEEIKISASNDWNKDFPIKLNHDYDSPNLGVVLRLFWDDSENILKAEGRINDKKAAKLIKEQNVKKVSVTVIGKVIWKDNKPMMTNLRYTELSLVKEGENPGNYIKQK